MLLCARDLSNNALTGELPDTLGALWNLVYLDLSSNRFVGVVPLSLAQATRLEHLVLADNRLCGCWPLAPNASLTEWSVALPSPSSLPCLSS